MTNDSEHSKRSGISRRADDILLRDKISKHELLFDVGQLITSQMDRNDLFEVIIAQTNKIMDTERSTVYLHDEEREELWSFVATGLEKDEIRMSSDDGMAGWVFQRKTPLMINDVQSDPRFYSAIDKKTGFRTENTLCMPLINRTGQCIGVLQTLNKHSGVFEGQDEELLGSICHYVTVALENSRLYEDVKRHAEALKRNLIHIETLEKIKGQLTKFVPSSVVKLVEQNPAQLTREKVPLDVTVLFIDIDGFSKITEGYDQRLVNDMVECHFSNYLACISEHNGEVNETSGDGLMVIFKEGPLESNAREAVAAGLGIVSENIRLNEVFSYPWGRVELHLGINSGEAWVGATKMKSLTGERWTYTASGLVTILAARIGALSGETQLYIGSETYKHVRDECVCEFVGANRVKNVTGEIPVYWAKGFQNKTSRAMD